MAGTAGCSGGGAAPPRGAAGAGAAANDGARCSELRLLGAPVVCGVVLHGADLRLYLHQLAETGGAGGGGGSGQRMGDRPQGGAGGGGDSGVHEGTPASGWPAGAALPPGVLRTLRSKACRGAVMFGDALTRGECSALVARLAATRMPFCCAHGRPTAAPLVDLSVLRRLLARRARGTGATEDAADAAAVLGAACAHGGKRRQRGPAVAGGGLPAAAAGARLSAQRLHALAP